MKGRGSVPTIAIILLAIGLLFGVIGGYWFASNSLQLRIDEYEEQISSLCTQVEDYHAEIGELEEVIEELMALLAGQGGDPCGYSPTEDEVEGFLCTMRNWMRGAGDQPVDVRGETVKVFILFGQSNMVGQGNYSDYPEEMREESPYRLILEEEGWMMYRPHNRTRGQLPPGGENGMEVSFMYNLSQAFPDERIGIIKIAKGGTGIRSMSPDWTYCEANMTGDGWKGPLYRLIEERINLTKRTCVPEFAGVIMKQGGKDMELPEAAQGWTEEVRLIIEAIREDAGVPNLPFFVGTYFNATEMIRWEQAIESGNEAWIRRRIPGPIRGRTASFDILEQLAHIEQEIEDTYLVVHGWLPTSHDGLHFSTESQMEYGTMNYEKYMEVSGYPLP